MKSLKVISYLMAYPNDELVTNAKELADEIRGLEDLSATMKDEMCGLLHHITSGELMDRQEEYGFLFDSGRALSLLLFEHVHGDSRDRGQAMVDLMSRYEKNGFKISVRELPDYIPLFLEYLSHRPVLEAREWLADVSHILGLLSARLQERESPYHLLFDALLEIADIALDRKELQQQVATEERDDTAEAFDKVWEEEAVRFGADSALEGDTTSCRPQTETMSTKPAAAAPLHWVDTAQPPQAESR